MAAERVENVYLQDGPFTMVRYDNGDIGIRREDLPVPGMRWPGDRIQECAEALERLTNPKARPRRKK